MNRRRAVKLFGGLVSFALLMPLLSHEPRLAADDKVDTKVEVTRERAKPRGRLPAYFATVVSPSQREEVYSIQARYSKQIEDLQRQIDELAAARDKDVDAVLTPAQLEKVSAKRAEAKERRASRAKKVTEAQAESGS